MSDAAPNLAHVIIPGLPKLARTALAPASFERDQWAARLNRAQGTGKPCKIQYSHGSTGTTGRDGVHHYFGGPMIFSAWCACGRFRYHGCSELGRRNAIKAHKTWVGLTVNDVVTYHGSLVEHHGKEFVISAVDGDRLSLEDVEWGNVRLGRVHRASVDAAGRNWVTVTCGHPRYTRRASDGSCATYRCTGEPGSGFIIQ